VELLRTTRRAKDLTPQKVIFAAHSIKAFLVLFYGLAKETR